MFLQNFLYQQYYSHLVLQSWADFLFELYHHIMFDWFYKQIEPLYNPWVSVYYMCSSVPNENYYNLKKNNDFFGYYPFPNKLDLKDTHDENDRVFHVLNQRRIQMGHPPGVDFNFRGNNLEDEKRDDPFQIFDSLNSIYYAFNFIKTARFDVCYDYLILLKYRNMYISRVGVYNGMKNLRKEDFSMEKAARSILIVEYTHPKMSKSIVLNIDSGYFLENNEILSPMFIRRTLAYQSEPYVFDYGYKIRFMDSNIRYHTMDSTSFVLLKKIGYEIVKI